MDAELDGEFSQS